MIGKRMFVQIGLLVFTGILCSLLISCGSANTTSQPRLYNLDDALTLAAQTLQAESQVDETSKTPTPVEKANVSNEQADSKENPEKPVVPVTGDNGENPAQSVEELPGGVNFSREPHLRVPVDPDRVISIPPPRPPDPSLPGDNNADPNGSRFELDCKDLISCGKAHLDLIHSLPPLPPTSISVCRNSGDCEEEKEKRSDDTDEEPPPPQPFPVFPPGALPPPIFPPGYEPPVFQLP